MNGEQRHVELRKGVPDDLRDVIDRKLAIFDQIRALKAENRALRDQILDSGNLNSTAIAVAVMCW